MTTVKYALNEHVHSGRILRCTGVDVGQSGVDVGLSGVCSMHAACMSIVKYA